MYWVGIDNGTSGAVAIFKDAQAIEYFKMPIYEEQSYTKKAQQTSHVDCEVLKEKLRKYANDPEGCRCMRERPFTGMFYKAVVGAARADEATTIVLRELNISNQYCDSREWQRQMLPQNLGKMVRTKTGALKRKIEPAELKEASCDIACRLFPQFKDQLLVIGKKGKVKKHDGDALILCEYFRRYYGA